MGNESTTFVNRCVLVVRAVDLWTGKAPSGPIRVSIRGHNRAPLRTSDGSYAFLDYAYDRCTINVASPDYLEYERELELGGGVPILTAGLMPSKVRSSPAAAAGLRFRVVDDASGKPIKDAVVRAYVEDDRAICGRVADDLAVNGAAELRVSPATIKLLPGDAFVLRARDGNVEWGSVSAFGEDAGGEQVALTQPLGRTWPRGERLLMAAVTRSESDGTTTVPFRGILPAEFQVVVEARSGDRTATARLTGSGGEIRQFPDVRI